MIDVLARWFVKFCLWLRYRIRVRGIEEIAARGRSGILFLPNHPALIDPIIVIASLHKHFRPRAIADRDQMSRFFINWLGKRIRVIRIPDLRKHGTGVRDAVQQAVDQCVASLRAGDNLVLYPSGHLYRTRYENLRGNSSVETILREVPEARVVLIRTLGLWGSSFSMAAGPVPAVGRIMWRGVRQLLASFLFFAPRREVTLTLHEPEDLPREAPRAELNAALQEFYNAEVAPARYVPYTIWERGGVRELPDREHTTLSGELNSVPASVRQRVYAQLTERTGETGFGDDARLAEDLGLDSLAKAELMAWLAEEFGFGHSDVDALQTVGDVLLATRGEAVVVRAVELKPPDAAWSKPKAARRIELPQRDTINDVFLEQARRDPDRIVMTDQISGARTYRDVVLALHVLQPLIAALPGERVGIMLPAGVGACVTYLATLFAGKTPLLINWTTGSRNVAHALEVTGTQRILTAQQLVSRLKGQDLDLSALEDKLVPLESLRERISLGQKLIAKARSYLGWGKLAAVPATDVAAILMTSGSESYPKAVPLTHANILANLRDVTGIVEIRENDRLLNFLPPFHSFGLTVTMLLPMLGGASAVHHANPTEAWLLGQLIQSHGATLVCGTPTFLYGIARATPDDSPLESVRLAVTGAERCPARTYDALARCMPNAQVLEGYGISECSPIVAVNRVEDAQPETIGKVLPSLEWVIVDVDSEAPVEPGATGMLLVRGPSVFGGYLGGETASPFVEHEGKQWYRTGDLVSAAADGHLTFRGRLKRFVKLGGEMISLPAIEAVLEAEFGDPNADGPTIAVIASENDEHPELVLVTTQSLDRQAANRAIRAAALSPLHNLSRVERVAEIPTLGTGKTDYRTLQAKAG